MRFQIMKQKQHNSTSSTRRCNTVNCLFCFSIPSVVASLFLPIPILEMHSSYSAYANLSPINSHLSLALLSASMA